jgi:hypothetical protein
MTQHERITLLARATPDERDHAMNLATEFATHSYRAARAAGASPEECAQAGTDAMDRILERELTAPSPAA